ncbi:MAG TPA: Ig-like domain-containing protein [Longimicrobium sp.]|jgi:uncharacterized protein YjdB|uniref:Ig-like domain-containing protein n=1 Tax=Longimicrobium sp. TaxID=2029185 RepID=UPI002EDA63BF
MRPARFLPALALLALSAAACERAPASSVNAPEMASMTIVSGDNQAVLPGRELPDPLVVKVVNASGQPVQGQAVVFRVSSGGGRVFAGIAVSNAQGLARERWTVGTSQADSQRVQALGIDNATGEARIFATFRATLLTAAPAQMQKLSGDNQLVEAGARTDSMLKVVVRDASGNPSPSVSVTFTSDRGGTFYFYNPSVTGKAGVGGIFFTPKFGGSTRVTATAPGLQPVHFTVTSRWGVVSVRQTPRTLALAVGQTGQVQATAYNAQGSPIPDAPIRYFSNSPGIAAVDSVGKVTAKAPGTTPVFSQSERGVTSDTTWVTVTSASASVASRP